MKPHGNRDCPNCEGEDIETTVTGKSRACRCRGCGHAWDPDQQQLGEWHTYPGIASEE